MLELELDSPTDFQRTVGHRFAHRQWHYMDHHKMSEAEAYDKCQEEFKEEIKTFESSLDELANDGAERASFSAIKGNVSQHARIR